MTHRRAIQLTGLFWFLMGSWLLYKGLRFIAFGSLSKNAIASYFGDPAKGAAALIAIGLVLGTLKGRLILKKTVYRLGRRIMALPLPLSFKTIYPSSYWILIGSMMALGMLLNVLPISLDLRGCVDVAIGSALINGAMLYFRFTYGRESLSQSLGPDTPVQ